MMGLMARQEVAELPGFGMMLMPGPTALFLHKGTWTVNPSYVPLFIFERFSSIQPAGPWGAIAMNIPRLLEAERAPWVCDGLGGLSCRRTGSIPRPLPARSLPRRAEQKSDAKSDPKPSQTEPKTEPKADPAPALGSYDAIRVYLWAGMLGEGQTRTDTDRLPFRNGLLSWQSWCPPGKGE